ncbi:hypothetical protein SAMN05216203_3398 [Marinobacter daqiaonensis]|uniref:Uncharacterized protein n=1 Tax=Marinobacter daqiaonensis TaxID=650891 RepID=A0A1I6JWP7_9GAMM|nr:hypothetical protein [Marinobacter daqiaonensis]SFR83373.1 hypothetical protein SAMN05216203_3398 [Marinobacter daqiaonensis]
MNTYGQLRPYCLAFLAAAVLLSPTSLLAQGRDDLDVTMRMVVDDEDLSDGLVQELQLPASPLARQNERGAKGRQDAEDMREQGRALGRRISEEARDRREERPLGKPGDGLDLPGDSPRDDIGGERPGPGMDPGNRPERPDQGARP